MGAFGTHHIDFSKSQPSMYAVDLAIPSGDEDIVEGMGIHVGDDLQWYRGCPAGKLPFVTGQGQAPTELDVDRETYQMGAGNMGAIALSQGLQFDTTEFVAGCAKRYVSCLSTGANAGKFKEASEDEQIVGWCLSTFSDPDGDSVARIVACVMPSIGDGYSSVSSVSESSQSLSSQSDVSTSSQSLSSVSSQSLSSVSSQSDVSTSSQSLSTQSDVSTASTASTDSTASTESTESTVSLSTQSDVSTASTDSTESTESTESTVSLSSQSDVSTDTSSSSTQS